MENLSAPYAISDHCLIFLDYPVSIARLRSRLEGLFVEKHAGEFEAVFHFEWERDLIARRPWTKATHRKAVRLVLASTEAKRSHEFFSYRAFPRKAWRSHRAGSRYRARRSDDDHV